MSDHYNYWWEQHTKQELEKELVAYLKKKHKNPAQNPQQIATDIDAYLKAKKLNYKVYCNISLQTGEIRIEIV